MAHWEAVADPAHKDAYFWVVVRHEIDYLRAAHEGDRITARTWVGDAPQGARFDRFVEFTGADGKVCVRAKTQWAIIDKALGRPIRVPPEVVAPFVTRGVSSRDMTATHPLRLLPLVRRLPRAHRAQSQGRRL